MAAEFQVATIQRIAFLGLALAGASAFATGKRPMDVANGAGAPPVAVWGGCFSYAWGFRNDSLELDKQGRLIKSPHIAFQKPAISTAQQVEGDRPPLGVDLNWAVTLLPELADLVKRAAQLPMERARNCQIRDGSSCGLAVKYADAKVVSVTWDNLCTLATEELRGGLNRFRAAACSAAPQHSASCGANAQPRPPLFGPSLN